MVSICEGKKAKIDYPVFWEYKLILDSKSDEKSIARECVGSRAHTLEPSNKSKNGKFKSFNLRVLVNSETERLELFSLLKKYSKFVL